VFVVSNLSNAIRQLQKLKKTMKKIILSVCTVLFFAQCQKEKNTATPVTSNTNNASSKTINQKLYDLSFAKTDNLVKAFKAQANAQNNTKQLSSNLTLALDSSIWLLEAALNSDFDEDAENNSVLSDSLVINIPIGSNGTVSQEDFNTAYLTLKASVTPYKTSAKGVKLIDATATQLDATTLKYRLDITYFNKATAASALRFINPCDQFNTQTASPCKTKTVGNNFINCPITATLLDGPTIIKDRLNGCGISLCMFGYYTNVTTLYWQYANGDISLQNTLYGRYNLTPSNFCLTQNSTISTATLNQYRNNIRNLAIANIPASPSGMIIRNYDIEYFENFLLCYCPNQTYNPYWRLSVTYAKPVCP
jgi:hypothetical protein